MSKKKSAEGPAKNLLLMRHAKSDWSETGTPDHQRRLNKRGRKAAPLMGQWLLRQSLVPDLIVSSSAVRAHETADLIAPTLRREDRIMVEPRLYMPRCEDFIEVLRDVDESANCVLLISHNPAIEHYLSRVTGGAVSMPTAAIADLVLPISHWSELSMSIPAMVRHVWRPKEIGSVD